MCHRGSFFFNVLSNSYQFKLLLMLQYSKALQLQEGWYGYVDTALVAWHIGGSQRELVQSEVDCKDWEWAQRSQNKCNVCWTASRRFFVVLSGGTGSIYAGSWQKYEGLFNHSFMDLWKLLVEYTVLFCHLRSLIYLALPLISSS